MLLCLYCTRPDCWGFLNHCSSLHLAWKYIKDLATTAEKPVGQKQKRMWEAGSWWQRNKIFLRTFFFFFFLLIAELIAVFKLAGASFQGPSTRKRQRLFSSDSDRSFAFNHCQMTANCQASLQAQPQLKALKAQGADQQTVTSGRIYWSL